MGVRGEIFSNRIILPNRTYFFNVKENRLGDLYLNIVESKNRDNGGFDRQSVILFADDLQEFLKGFDESLKVMEKAVREKRHSGGDTNRKPGVKPGAKPDADTAPSKTRAGNAGIARRDEKFRRGEKGEERGRRSERGERGKPNGSKPPRGKPPIDRKNTKERWGERTVHGGGEKSRYNSGGERSRGRSSERGQERSYEPRSERRPKENKRVVVRKRDRDN